MVSRLYLIPALTLWFASTTWLFSTKILPTLAAGKPPAYSELLPKTPSADEPPIRWSIHWNEEEIGWAENKISRNADGTGSIVSEVQFEQLPVDQIMRDVMGILGQFAQSLHGEIGPLELRVLTVLHFDNFASLSHFETDVDVGELPGLLQIEGRIRDEKLNLVARVGVDGDGREVLSRKEIRLPPEALVNDTFSPRPRLSGLRVGQKWTFQSYRPLMPHSPMELIEATVEQKELLEWGGTMVRTQKVVYRKDSGSGLSSTRRPTSELWVRSDGTVLRQDLYLANIRVQFIRESNVAPPRSLSPPTAND